MNKKVCLSMWRNEINCKSLTCYLCGELILTSDDLSADHIIPKSKCGVSNSKNFAPTHKICNLCKGSNTPQYFHRYLKKRIAPVIKKRNEEFLNSQEHTR